MCDSPAAQSALIHAAAGGGGGSGGQFHHHHHYHLDEQEVEMRRDESFLEVSNIESNSSFPRKIQLEQDVQRLQQQLQEEMEVHATLENAIEKKMSKLSCPSCLPQHAQKLLSTIAVLETTVSKLEQEIVSLHFLLSQERNERRLVEYRLRHTASQSISETMRTVDAVKSTALFYEKKESMKTDANNVQDAEAKKSPKGMPAKGLWESPNQLSEEMVRCMKNIYVSLTDSAVPSRSYALESPSPPVSPRGHLSNSSWWSSSEHPTMSSWMQSPLVDIETNSDVLASNKNVFDPYRVRGKLSWADIGRYSLATEVSWMSVGKKQLEYASGMLRRFREAASMLRDVLFHIKSLKPIDVIIPLLNLIFNRTLVEQLAKVNPIHLSCDEKLSFWINLYNALVMHAYLAYGVPRSELKLFSLMQKAAYTVGGHSFSAAAIEYVILKMKPPLHRPQLALLLALHKLKVSGDQRKCAIDACEPLVAFALSCGMYSSPAVRIYTAKNVREELQDAQHDFIRASVGVSSKGKLLLPKMLHCFAKGIVDDSGLGVWMSHYLPPNQAGFVQQCISQRRQSLLGSRNCGILPFDSRFRYLFLPDTVSLQ